MSNLLLQLVKHFTLWSEVSAENHLKNLKGPDTKEISDKDYTEKWGACGSRILVKGPPSLPFKNVQEKNV
jgi:hypothetical protein